MSTDEPGKPITIDQWPLDEHGWDEHLVEGSGSYQPPPLPGFTLDVGLLWSWPE